MKKIFFLFLIHISLTGYTQVRIVGLIQSDSMHVKLSNVLISIAELNIVTQTDEAGLYQLKNLPYGKYNT